MIKFVTAVASIVAALQVDVSYADQLRGFGHVVGTRKLQTEGYCGTWDSKPAFLPEPLEPGCPAEAEDVRDRRLQTLEIDVCDHYEGCEIENDHNYCRVDACTVADGCTWESKLQADFPDEDMTCKDDGNDCTNDYCEDGYCTHPAKTE